MGLKMCHVHFFLIERLEMKSFSKITLCSTSGQSKFILKTISIGRQCNKRVTYWEFQKDVENRDVPLNLRKRGLVHPVYTRFATTFFRNGMEAAAPFYSYVPPGSIKRRGDGVPKMKIKI